MIFGKKPSAREAIGKGREGKEKPVPYGTESACNRADEAYVFEKPHGRPWGNLPARAGGNP